MDKRMEYCKGCLRFTRNTCDALKEPFPLWPKEEQERHGNCWARLTSKTQLLRETKEAREFYIMKNGDNHESVRTLNSRISKLEAEAAEEQKALKYEGLEEVYMEDIKRGEKGGGGEKADRTNKSFGPQQLRDNRFPHRKNNPRKYNGW